MARSTSSTTSLNRSSGTIRARATVPNADLAHHPRAVRAAAVATGEPAPALLVPAAAMVPDQSRQVVMTVSADGTVVPKVVDTGELYRRAAGHPQRPAADRPRGDRRARARASRRQGHAGSRRISRSGAGRAARQAEHRHAFHPHVFIDRPILATVVSVFVTLIGLGALSVLPVAQYPEIVPPTVQVTTSYPGASAEVVSQTVATPLEQEINGVENMLYMCSQSTGDGKLHHHRDLPDRHRPERRADADAEPGAGRLPRLPEDVQRLGVQVRKATPNILLAVHLYLAGRHARHALPVELRHAAHQGRAGAAAGRRRRAAVRRPRLCHAHLARSRTGGRARPECQRGARRAAGAERAGLGRLAEPAAGAGEAAFQLNVRRSGRLSTPEQFADIIVKTDAEDGSPGSATSAGSRSAPPITGPRPTWTTRPGCRC